MQDVQAKAVLDSIYARLGDLTTEQKAEAIRLLLATIDGKVSTAAKQDAAKAVLDSIAGKDFATQATLAAVLAKLSADPSTSAKQDAAKAVLDTLATAAKQDALKTVVDVISTAVASRASEVTLAQVKTELAAVKSELAVVKANQISGDQKVTLSGSKLAEQLTEADANANVLTFAANIGAIEIYHEEATWQEFVVNGLTVNVPAGYYRTAVEGVASAEVTIPAGVSCIVGRLV